MEWVSALGPVRTAVTAMGPQSPAGQGTRKHWWPHVCRGRLSPRRGWHWPAVGWHWPAAGVALARTGGRRQEAVCRRCRRQSSLLRLNQCGFALHAVVRWPHVWSRISVMIGGNDG